MWGSLIVEPVKLDRGGVSNVLYLVSIRCVLSCSPAFKLQVLKGNTSTEQFLWPCKSSRCGVIPRRKGEECQHTDTAVGFHDPGALL